MTGPTSCGTCNTLGLAILPVRYTVVPAALKPTLPDGISGKRVKDVALDTQQYQYALRTLRYGYVYLFYAKGPRGKNYWDAYSVSSFGDLTKQLYPPNVVPPSDIPCRAKGHIPERPSYFCIEQPQKCGTVWIAFSEHVWSDETINEYATNATLRGKRMQAIEPAAWINSPKHEHAAEATPASLEKVLEYRPGLALSELTRNNLSAISNVNGSYAADKLAAQTSRYPAHLRNDPKTPTSKQTVKHMHQSGLRPDGKSTPPMLLALWDSIGITHELNGYRNEAAGRIKQYGDERELEITALAAIEGAKKALEDKAEARVETMEQITKDSRMLDPGFLRKNAHSLPQPQQALRLDDINVIEQWNAQEVPPSYSTRLNQLSSLYNQASNWQGPALSASLAKREQQRTPIINEVNAYLKNRDPNKKAAIADARKQSWPKYEKKLNLATYTTFKTNYDKFLTDADKLIDQRTVELIKWLEAPLFIDTLEDYHGSNLRDGVEFEDVVGDAIFGMGSTKAGAQKLEAWVKEAKASIKTNLIWRAIALNQKEGIKEVDKALQIAIQAPAPLNDSAWDNAGAQIKFNKIADAYKKALSLHNANHKPGVIRQVNTRGVDKLFITVGDLFMKPFAKVTDTVNEKIVQSILLVRAGVSEASALGLVATQAKHEGVSRARMIQRINTTKTFVAPELTTERKALNQAWSALKSSADTPDAKGAFNAVKDARLGLVVAVLEGVNLWKISQSVSKDPKVQLQLVAASMATSAAMLDVVASGIKGLASESAISFQVLKVAGGVLSGGASFVGSALDWKDRAAFWEKEKYRIAIFYGFRSGFQFAGGIMSILVSISYADPLLKRLSTGYARNAAISAALRMGSASTGWLLGARAGLMLAGLGFSVATLVISAAIWGFSDNELQNWCEESAFGTEPKDKRFPTAKVQMESFDKALLDVL